MGYGDPLVTTDGPTYGQPIVRNVGTGGGATDGLTSDEHAAVDHAGIPGVPATPPVTFLEATINLTNAQILGMNAAPVQVIAAPGANQRIVVVEADIALDNAAGLYTAGGNAVLTLATVSVGGTIASAFFTADASASKLYAVNGTPAGTAAMVNQALFISNLTAAFTGGNAANKATVRVVYLIRSTLPV